MSFLRAVAAVGTSAVLVACAGSGELAQMCPAPSGGVPEYVIGAGDVLNVFVWQNPELSTDVEVRPDGMISTPLVEDMVAGGKTPTTLARDIENVLAEYVRSPTVNVMVQTPGGSNQIQVVGQVMEPKSVPYKESIRLLDVLLEAGGLQEFAAGNRAKVSRRVDDQLHECDVRLEDLVNGDLSQNIRMFPGDVLVVPEARF